MIRVLPRNLEAEKIEATDPTNMQNRHAGSIAMYDRWLANTCIEFTVKKKDITVQPVGYCNYSSGWASIFRYTF